jgi:hypothetical protein
MAGLGNARGPRDGVMLFLGGASIVVPWGLFALALASGSGGTHRDNSFVFISLIYALISTPVAACILWAGSHDTS